MKLSFWIFIIVAVLLVTFSVQNSGPTEIQFLVWSIQVSKAVIIIATFLIGLITGALYGYFSRKPTVLESGADNTQEEVIATVDEDMVKNEDK